MPDQRNVTSPAPGATPQGIITVEEVWSEIGTPPTDAPFHDGWVSESQIQGIINRVVRQYEDRAIQEIEASREVGAFAHHAEPITLPVGVSTDNSRLGTTDIPANYLPSLFDKVMTADGYQLHPDDRIATTARLSFLPKYRYQISGRVMDVLPKDIDAVTAYLIQTTKAVETVLGEAVPEINERILAAAREMHERILAVNRGIQAESKSETPDT